jgi:hypothetical protein
MMACSPISVPLGRFHRAILPTFAVRKKPQSSTAFHGPRRLKPRLTPRKLQPVSSRLRGKCSERSKLPGTGSMTIEKILKIFAADAEDARFRDWAQGRRIQWRFVYLCEYGTIWRFESREWWRFVRRTIRNNGAYDIPLSRSLRNRPKHISKGVDDKWYSSDNTVRCVNPLDWTVEDWKNELF